MWSLDDCKHAFVAVGLIGVIIFSMPSAMTFVHLPGGERFSELYVLGSMHMADAYPFNVSAGREYSVYLGIVNHMGDSTYYGVHVKFRNASEPLPNATGGIPSSLPVLYSYRAFMSEGQTWERALNFSFSDVVLGQNVSSVGGMKINDAVVRLDKSVVWDSANNGYFYQVFMELWIFNATSNDFGFHNRFVSLWFNMTAAS